VDEAKFQMAFLNILSNALKYSEADTPVILKVHQTHDQDGHWIGIEVQDTGGGIKEEDMAKLFTRFYRADPTSAVSGTGLGLHLVKEIMTQMNGRVDIQSVYGQGTKACLWVKQSNSEKAA
jgi:signal transduction histidine kinase